MLEGSHDASSSGKLVSSFRFLQVPIMNLVADVSLSTEPPKRRYLRILCEEKIGVLRERDMNMRGECVLINKHAY